MRQLLYSIAWLLLAFELVYALRHRRQAAQPPIQGSKQAMRILSSSHECNRRCRFYTKPTGATAVKSKLCAHSAATFAATAALAATIRVSQRQRFRSAIAAVAVCARTIGAHLAHRDGAVATHVATAAASATSRLSVAAPSISHPHAAADDAATAAAVCARRSAGDCGAYRAGKRAAADTCSR